MKKVYGEFFKVGSGYEFSCCSDISINTEKRVRVNFIRSDPDPVVLGGWIKIRINSIGIYNPVHVRIYPGLYIPDIGLALSNIFVQNLRTIHNLGLAGIQHLT